MSTDPEMGPDTWRRIAPGTDFIPLGEARGPGLGDFDSHICFASALPLRLDDEIRVFYMGGDGPHYSPAYPSALHRNSSFGLATLRPDGFVAVRARAGQMPHQPAGGRTAAFSPHSKSGTGKTTALVVTGGQLVVTADTALAGGAGAAVTITAGGRACGTVSGRNVTDFALAGCGGMAVGTQVTLEIVLSGDALLYTVGFDK